MATRNLYIPDKHEKTIKRLEKLLSEKRQSLSHFVVSAAIKEVEANEPKPSGRKRKKTA